MKLENRKAIVTGAAKGMGAAITTTLAREGADVVLAARDTEALETVASKVRGLGRKACVVACDVTDEGQVEAMVAKALEFFDGGIDILVNVAGVTGPIETPVQDIKAEEFDYVISLQRARYVPADQARGADDDRPEERQDRQYRRHLRPARLSHAHRLLASKWAVRGITRTVALELGKYNINVNAVCPGIVETPRMQKLCAEKAKVRGWTVKEVYDEYVEDMALKRVTTPQDVADAVLFMASDDSRQITGQHLAVDGGWDV